MIEAHYIARWEMAQENGKGDHAAAQGILWVSGGGVAPALGLLPDGGAIGHDFFRGAFSAKSRLRVCWSGTQAGAGDTAHDQHSTAVPATSYAICSIAPLPSVKMPN